MTTINYVRKPIKRRKDSFWYDGQVATVVGDRTISVEAQGHISVTFNINEDTYADKQARTIARKRGYTDKKLSMLNNHDGWGNNNWFAFYWVENDEFLTPTSVNYDEAIKIAKELSKFTTE